MPNKNKHTKPSKPAKAAAAPAKKAVAKPAKHAAPAKKAAPAPAKKHAAPAPAAKKHAAPPAKKHAAPAPAAKKHAAPAKAHAPAPAAKKHDKHEKHEKHAAPAKHDKHEKHEKHAAPAAAAKKTGERRIVGAAPGSTAKDGKKGTHLKVVPQPEAEAAPATKKKAEVVVEVPAPKGVAILRGGKAAKKGKSESSASALGKKRCREPGCDHELLLSGYCRLHYIKNWRKIKRKEAILASGQLNNYVEELVNKYPDKYLDVIRQDLASEKEWAKVVVDLELESADEEGSEEDIDAAAEGVSAGGGRGFDDDSDTF